MIGNLGNSNNEIAREVVGITKGVSEAEAQNPNNATNGAQSGIAGVDDNTNNGLSTIGSSSNQIAQVAKSGSVATGLTIAQIKKLNKMQLAYDDSVKNNDGQLECRKDDEILQWDDGNDKWQRAKPIEIVFGKIDKSTMVVRSNGSMKCRDNNDIIYWDGNDDEWSCGGIGDGITAKLGALDDVDLTAPANGELLLFDGANWKDASMSTALGGLGVLSPGAGAGVGTVDGALTCANNGEILQYNNNTKKFDCVAASSLATAEADTLQSVTDRGATSTNSITVAGLTTAGTAQIGTLSVTDNTILGDASTDTLTLNSETLAIPNNLNIDSGTLFVDSTNNRVGIGTTSPAYDLEIKKTYQGTDGYQLAKKTLTVDIPEDKNSYYITDLNYLETPVGFDKYTRGMIAQRNTIERRGSGSVFYGSGLQSDVYVRDTTFWRYLGSYSAVNFYDDTRNESVSGFGGIVRLYNNSKVTSGATGNYGGIYVYNNADVARAIGGNFLVSQNSTVAIDNAYGVSINFSGSGPITNAYGLYLNDISGYGTNKSYSIYSAGGNNYFAGNVGIGTETPTEKLTVYNGSTTGTYTASGWVHSSDRRFKTNIEPIEGALALVDRLEGMTFNWNSDASDNQQVGFIAQDVAQVLPQVVVGNEEDGYGISYGNIAALLTQAIKEQSAQIDANKLTIASLLPEDIAPEELRAQIAQMREQNEAITTFINAINPETLLYTDADGNLELEGVLVASEVKTDKLSVEKIEINSEKAIGTVKIAKGEKKVKVKSEAVKKGDKVFVTVRKTPVAVAVDDVKDGEFEIVIAEKRDKDLLVDWWIGGAVGVVSENDGGEIDESGDIGQNVDAIDGVNIDEDGGDSAGDNNVDDDVGVNESSDLVEMEITDTQNLDIGADGVNDETDIANDEVVAADNIEQVSDVVDEYATTDDSIANDEIGVSNIQIVNDSNLDDLSAN